MSRIGKLPIPVPKGVEVQLDRSLVRIKGPRGSLERRLHPDMRIKLEDDRLIVTRPSDLVRHRALHGLTRSLVANMVQGVCDGYEKKLEIHGVGYRAEKKGPNLVLHVGYSHQVDITPPDGIQFDLESPTLIKVSGIDKEKIGQSAAEIRKVRPPEPYKGKGIRYQGEHVRRKAGKATA